MIIKHKPVKLGNVSDIDIKKAAKIYDENIPKMEKKMKPLRQGVSYTMF